MVRALLTLVLLAAPALAQGDAELQAFLEETLAVARDKADLPAVAARIQIDGKVAADVALGVRALGQPALVTVDDRWHIGSDTKAFASTMIARLVEREVVVELDYEVRLMLERDSESLERRLRLRTLI